MGWIDYDDSAAWDGWFRRIRAAIQRDDPWALLVMRPDGDLRIVDVLDGWPDRVKSWNGRTVWLINPRPST